MSRGTTNKLYRTFVKGLNTESGPLTYPEDASSDELNTVIHRKGNRSRRFGIDYETSSVPHLIPSGNTSSVVTEYLWKSADNDSNKNFLAVQFAHFLQFFDVSVTPITAGGHPVYIDLRSYKTPTATLQDLQSKNISMIAGKGFLFVAQEFMDPIVIQYNQDTDTFTATRIIIQIRDFDGVYDGLANDEEPTSLSAEHHYNLKNQGWVAPGTVGVGSIGGTSTGSGGWYDPWTGGFKGTNLNHEQEV